MTFTSDFQFKSIDGLDVTMICSIILKNENSYPINFEFKSKIVEENDNRIITEFKQGQEIGKKLKIINLEKRRDEGNYSCVLTDRFKKTYIITRNLQIYNPPMVIFEHVNRTIEANAGDEIFKLFLNFKTPAFPKPIFNISNPKIEFFFCNFSNSNQKKYDVKINETTVELTVKQVNFDDFGYYNFLATFDGNIFFGHDVEVIVNDKPNVSFPEIFVRYERKILEMKCHVRGYPKANISWSE